MRFFLAFSIQHSAFRLLTSDAGLTWPTAYFLPGYGDWKKT